MNILIPLDSSRASEMCVDFYLSKVHKEGNKLFTCYVADYFGDVGFMDGPSPSRMRELETQDLLSCVQIDTVMKKVLKAQNIEGCFVRLEASDPPKRILRYAAEIKADLIIIGSKVQSKVRRSLAGSCSETVLNRADVPVLVCKF